jgi:hypothetical protein
MRARDTWLAINAKVDEVSGRWIRAGEDSRWEISTTSWRISMLDFQIYARTAFTRTGGKVDDHLFFSERIPPVITLLHTQSVKTAFRKMLKPL